MNITDLPLSEAVCCRSWPVSGYFRLAPCGYCGQVPVIVGPWTGRIEREAGL